MNFSCEVVLGSIKNYLIVLLFLDVSELIPAIQVVLFIMELNFASELVSHCAHEEVV